MSSDAQWLSRTEKNQIAGPFTRSEICERVHDGTLTGQDEVCASGGFWFHLRDREQTRKYLKMELPHGVKGFEEITETQTETQTDLDALPNEASKDLIPSSTFTSRLSKNPEWILVVGIVISLLVLAYKSWRAGINK